jgi:hypothetical protein
MNMKQKTSYYLKKLFLSHVINKPYYRVGAEVRSALYFILPAH